MSNIVVVGSYVTDLMSRTPHMPKPGETVLGGPFQMGPGGKGGNQAVAAARLGTNVTMVTKLGNDIFGEEAYKNFTNEGISTDYIYRDSDEATGAALITVDNSGENMIVVALGACGKITKNEVNEAEKAFEQADIILIQLETSMEAIETAVKLANRLSKPVVLNPAPYQEISDELLSMVKYVTPNETEASLLTGIEVNDDETAEKAAKVLIGKGIDTVIITMGKQGCFLLERNNLEQGIKIASVSVNAVDTTGAGDAFNGAFSHFIAEGKAVKEACQLANVAAGLSVTKVGTSPAMPYLTDVEKLLK